MRVGISCKEKMKWELGSTETEGNHDVQGPGRRSSPCAIDPDSWRDLRGRSGTSMQAAVGQRPHGNGKHSHNAWHAGRREIVNAGKALEGSAKDPQTLRPWTACLRHKLAANATQYLFWLFFCLQSTWLVSLAAALGEAGLRQREAAWGRRDAG